MMNRRLFLSAAAGAAATTHATAWAHHGWSSFDQERPLYLEGRAQAVKWRNPHAELSLELPATLRLPADLGQRSVPAQSAQVDGRALLARAGLPTRSDRRWEIELAPLSRLEQWKVPPIANGATLAVLGFTFAAEKGEAVLRAEYLFLDGRTYALRSSPA
jgi:hypothetical protein